MFMCRSANIRANLRKTGLWLAILSFPLLSLAAKNFVMPAVKDAKSYPAHDTHPEEFVTVALDPYDTAEKADIFTIKYREIGYLPVFMVVTNDGDKPVSLTGMKAQWVTADRSKLSPATEDDIYRRVSHPRRGGGSPYPLPFPTGKVKGGVKKEARDEIENSRFRAHAVEPHTSQAGFLFFEISDIAQPLTGAHFYLTGARDADGHELMYFEVPIEKYVGGPANP